MALHDSLKSKRLLSHLYVCMYVYISFKYKLYNFFLNLKIVQ